MVVVDLFLERAQKTVEMIKKEGGSAIAIDVDVLSPVGCKKVVEKTLKEFSRIDFLDNNIGLVFGR